jgi:hypothetical protein
MQSSKTSKKTSKSAQPAAAPLANDQAVKPRAKSSTSKPETATSVAVAQPRKATVPAPIPAAATHSDQPKQVPVKQITHDDIAKLAHSLWAARGFAHGFAEEDWLRAERQLKGLAAAN